MDEFIAKQFELLDIERDAEIEENKCLQEQSSVKNLQKKGLCIPKIRYIRSATGLFGRSLLYFESFWGDHALPSHALSSGDIVGVGNTNADGRIEIITSGIVTRVTEKTIAVAFEKNSNFSDIERDTQYVIIKLANDVTYKRLKRALKSLQSKGQHLHLVDVLFGSTSPSQLDKVDFHNINFYNQELNEDQKEAVRFSLLQKDLAIIHGPPGTGKTTTVVECILQAVSQKMKVLACAPSNIAVDNLVEKLASHKTKIVRLGHPARFLPTIQQHSLDAIISHYDGSNVVDELRKEIDKLREKIDNTKGAKFRKSLWEENKSLLKEVKAREKFIVKQILTNVEVILCTLTSGSDDGPLKYLEDNHFDICFIDECSQAIETACWIPLLHVKKCVLAGDHNQLPPTIISNSAAKQGLDITLMERQLKLHGEDIKRMLTIQYRMNDVIMHWPSEKLYDSKLTADDSVKSHLLTDLQNIEDNDDTSIPLLVIDTAGCGLHELQTEDEESKGNEGEADLVSVHVKNLIKSGLDPADIAIITPYNLQVELIKTRFAGRYPKLEIKSVDGFQGREKEAVVISLVRSNDIGEIGFLSEDRRINVAITRAKRHLAVVCDSRTICCHPFLKSFFKYCEEKGEVRSAFQYEAEIGNYPRVKTKQDVSPVKKEHKALNIRKKSKSDKRNKDSSVKVDHMSNFKVEQNDRKIPKEEEYRITTEKYSKVIEDFLRSKETHFPFSSSLSSYDRRIVHEIAEKFGLCHTSSGEGADRYIELKKQVSNVEVLSETPHLSVSPNKFEMTQTNASAEHIPHPSLNNEKIVREKKTSKTKKSPASNFKVKQGQNSQSTVEDDFDAIIAQVVQADRTCSFDKCKKCIAVLSQVCEFCRLRFCFSHSMPEIHGCGEAAKMQARARIRKEGVLYSGSGKPQKKVDPIKHSYLQKKLDKKISELSGQRKPKPKE